MLDKNNMSAPTSLTTATIGSNKEQFQQSVKGSLSEMAGGKQAKLLNRPESELLIEAKFNELAKKILEELKQAQYSKEFFQAIDNIIKEPMTKTLLRQPQQQTTFWRPRLPNQTQRVGTLPLRQQSFGEHYQEPRSLPMEKQPSPALTGKQMQQQQVSSKQKSAIPTSNGAHKNVSPRKVASENGTNYPINKSATVDDATLRRHTSVRKSLITTSQQEGRKSSSATQRQLIKRRFMVNGVDDEDEDEDDLDDDFDDFDDDDDDDDLTGGGDYLRSRPSFQSRKQSYLQNSIKTTQPNNHPISKSKTLSDATNLQSSDTTSTKSPNSNKQPTLKPTARKSPLYQHQPSTIQQGTSVASNKGHLKSTGSSIHQRLNPITRSNTVTASDGSGRMATTSSVIPTKYSAQEREFYSRHSPSEPKSMILNSKDIRSLYKPHMNYSTSVLGNHRLSDDDEIIIIPTQSPSLVSTSPDGEVNQDELTERFSISRTKSFWEKLSKGSSGRRSNGAESNSGESNNGCITHNKVGRITNNTTQSYSLSSTSGNKASMNMNGHTLDRMDSTGGSNSNYNGSSSGDENGACYSSQQNPTLRELEEMSRQNRLRQTR